MKEYIVYMHTSPSGKVYIGITSRRPEVRWGKEGQKYKSSPHFYAAIKKYGWDNFKHEIVLEGLDKTQAGEMEKQLIKQYDSTNPKFGYNQTYGGDFGSVMIPSVKEKIGMKSRAYYSIPENREMLRQKVTGYRHTEEAKRKMSEHHMGLSVPRTNEWRQHMSEAKRKLCNDPEFREQHKKDFQRLASLGIENSKRVMQIDGDGNVVATYDSMKDAYRKTGIRDGNISKCCRNPSKRAGGYYWRICQK